MDTIADEPTDFYDTNHIDVQWLYYKWVSQNLHVRQYTARLRTLTLGWNALARLQGLSDELNLWMGWRIISTTKKPGSQGSSL